MRSTFMLRRRRLVGACGLALAVPGAAAQAEAAPQDGEWFDAARQRGLRWRLRLPAGAGPWPCIVYSHGLGGSREGGAAWGRAWADAGLAVLHLQHGGSDIDTARQGLGALRRAASPAQLLARVADVRFAIDELARRAALGTPWDALRPDALGMAGHSFGAHTTMALAGQRFPGGASGAEPRLRAFVALSPAAPADGRATPAEAFGAITRPVLVCTGSADDDPLGGTANGQTRATVYDGLPPGQRALLWLDGADHASFGGGRPPGLARLPRAAGPSAADARMQALVARISAQWWRSRLLGDAAAAAALAQPDGLGPLDRWQQG